MKPESILYRQHILADCLEHPELSWRFTALPWRRLNARGRSGAGCREVSRGHLYTVPLRYCNVFVGLLKKLRKISR